MTFDSSSVAPTIKQATRIDDYFNAIPDADIRLLRVFCVVVANGGLSAATTELQADLSTVSRHLKDLEDKIGVRLCHRGRSGFSLTAQGLMVHGAAQELFRALKSFRESISTLHDDPVGELKLGVMDALLSDPQFLLPAALRDYRRKAPRVQVRLTVSKPNDIERLVSQGELDAGIVAARERPPGLHYRQLYTEKSSLYCARHHPLYACSDAAIGLEDARALDLVEDPYTESLPLRGFAGVLRKAASADSIEAVALLVVSGDYVGFLPDHYAATLGATTALRRIRPDIFSYEQGIDLVWRSGPLNPFVRGLFDSLGLPQGAP